LRRAEFNALAGVALSAGLITPAAAKREAPAISPLPGSAPTFAQARDGIRAIVARDNADPSLIKPALSRLYEHGGQVETAVVLFHGFTNCPQQFDELARGFHARGCNVYVPRIPYHGNKDRLTRDLSRLTVPLLADCAVEAYGLARGLGRRVAALGLSLGGSMALYLGQTQPIDLAVPVSPFLMPIGFPKTLGTLGMRLLNWLPDQYWWWDPRVKADCKPPYAYPGYTTHALAECIFLGDALFNLAAERPPAGKDCVLVTNRNESAVNNDVTRNLLSIWTRAGGVDHEVVLSGLGPPRHDIIDPTTFPQGRTLVYPRLEAIVLDNAR
jgi:pimeloyl-ACP methyl ester carboxylesterase